MIMFETDLMYGFAYATNVWKSPSIYSSKKNLLFLEKKLCLTILENY